MATGRFGISVLLTNSLHLLSYRNRNMQKLHPVSLEKISVTSPCISRDNKIPRRISISSDDPREQYILQSIQSFWAITKQICVFIVYLLVRTVLLIGTGLFYLSKNFLLYFLPFFAIGLIFIVFYQSFLNSKITRFINEFVNSTERLLANKTF